MGDWSTDVESSSAPPDDELSAMDKADMANRDAAVSWANTGGLRYPGVPAPDDSYAGKPQIGTTGYEDGGGPPLDDAFAASGVHLDTEHGHNKSLDDDLGWAPWNKGQVVARAVDPYSTHLAEPSEREFQMWSHVTGLQPTPGYDLRGYWKALVTGKVAPPAHGSEHALPPEWVTPLDLKHFTTSSRFHPRNADGDADIIDARFPLTSKVWTGDSTWVSPGYDLQGKELAGRDPAFTDELAASPREGVRHRSDRRLNDLTEGNAPAEWSTAPTIHAPAPIERANITAPPVRQRSHTAPRGR